MPSFPTPERKLSASTARIPRIARPPFTARQMLAGGAFIDDALIDETAEEAGFIERVKKWKITVNGKEFAVKDIATVEEDAEDEFEGPAVKVSLGFWYKDGKKLYRNAIKTLAESKGYKVKTLPGEPYNLFIGKGKV